MEFLHHARAMYGAQRRATRHSAWPLWSTSARSCALSLLATASSLSRAAILIIALLVVLPAQLPGGCSRLLPRADDVCDAVALICEADSSKPLYPETTLLHTCIAETSTATGKVHVVSV